ncbi:DUF3043 domain-containing protein [Marihabitans asiaticum]|uniref:DUF3043 family protein n=1 Tax=Marihabitans asiaticum TaxID=415218 RepID=A0A560W7M1_9MICO|nr:DUF3043 domain-containing protein [Marihabitans asiaticum]TWD13607.1 DUF3043 family protein [Marihabitans asiaticum]
MFGRKKQSENERQAATAEERPQREGAKNRPTPKRRDQEAARKRPLVADDRKQARARDKEKRRESNAKMRQAMVSGDDRHLPARDKGPVRRFVRDRVDSTFQLGEILLIVMLAVLVLSLFAPRQATLVFLSVYIIFAIALVQAIATWRKTKRLILEKFGEDTELRGLALYSVLRSFQMRRTRLPRPQVERGAEVT